MWLGSKLNLLQIACLTREHNFFTKVSFKIELEPVQEDCVVLSFLATASVDVEHCLQSVSKF